MVTEKSKMESSGSVLAKPQRKKTVFLGGFAVELAAITALIGMLVPVAVKFIEHYWPVAEQTSAGG